ncbi:uncharacterized protein G2W53_003750 [Senna tora]|uniref:Uncharacterized protein n=1 Tax=Senna tora TaxID=362788 RepID=A0A834XB77_9FABA|nr:uncharacterized protein G2W53_003750 [Senna tora]
MEMMGVTTFKPIGRDPCVVSHNPGLDLLLLMLDPEYKVTTDVDIGISSSVMSAPGPPGFTIW